MHLRVTQSHWRSAYVVRWHGAAPAAVRGADSLQAVHCRGCRSSAAAAAAGGGGYRSLPAGATEGGKDRGRVSGVRGALLRRTVTSACCNRAALQQAQQTMLQGAARVAPAARQRRPQWCGGQPAARACVQCSPLLGAGAEAGALRGLAVAAVLDGAHAHNLGVDGGRHAVVHLAVDLGQGVSCRGGRGRGRGQTHWRSEAWP